MLLEKPSRSKKTLRPLQLSGHCMRPTVESNLNIHQPPSISDHLRSINREIPDFRISIDEDTWQTPGCHHYFYFAWCSYVGMLNGRPSSLESSKDLRDIRWDYCQIILDLSPRLFFADHRSITMAHELSVLAHSISHYHLDYGWDCIYKKASGLLLSYYLRI
jgi:hypothetical protein